ncbi:MAG: hypothetical protein R6V07_10790, partial [Armatimonadota bacterium]
MISKKKRCFIFLSYLITASVVVTIQILPGIANVGLNQKDPLYFDREMRSTYSYRNGAIEAQDLTFNVVDVGSSQSGAKVSIGGKASASIEYTHDGYYVDPSTQTPTEYQSPLWIHITGGDRSEIRDYVGEEFKVLDPTGIYGEPNQEYTYVILENDVYWSEEPGLHGAQFSLKFDILDESGAGAPGFGAPSGIAGHSRHAFHGAFKRAAGERQ